MPDTNNILGDIGNVFRRLISKPPARKPVPVKPVPQDAYTRDVATRGTQAVNERRAAASAGRVGATTRLDLGGMAHANDPTADYMKWVASKNFAPDYTPTFGQSKDGNYAGFRTEGELKAAVTGRADQARMADVAAAQTRASAAQTRLDELNSSFDDSWKQYQTALSGSQATIDKLGQGHDEKLNFLERLIPGNWGKPASHHVDPTADEQSQAASEQAYADQLKNQYAPGLEKWLADQSQGSIDQLQTADQIQRTPLRLYQGSAGADYGVDPNLVAGWFPESTDVTDFTNQRNIESIDQNGMPFTDYRSYLNELDQRQQQADRQATTDATAADKQATDDQTAQIAQVVGDATGMDANQLAQAVNMTPMQVAQVVQDPNYQAAATDLENVLFAPAFDPSNPQTAQDISDIIDSEAIRADPQIRSLLSEIYGQYFS